MSATAAGSSRTLAEDEVGSARIAGIAGITSVVLVVAARLVAGSAPDQKASAHAIASYYASPSHWHRQEAGLIIGALSMVFFLPFVGGLRARLHADRTMSSVALGAGAVFAALYAALTTMRGVTSFVLDGSRAFRAAGLDLQLVRSFEEAHALFFVFALVAGAVLIGASSLSALRTTCWPSWVSYAGLVIALLVLIGAFLAAGAVFLLLAWIIVVGLVFLLQQPSP